MCFSDTQRAFPVLLLSQKNWVVEENNQDLGSFVYNEPPQLILEWLFQPQIFLLLLLPLPSLLAGLSLLRLAWGSDSNSQSRSSLCGKGGRAKNIHRSESWEVMWICVIQATRTLRFLGYLSQVTFKAQFNQRLISLSLLFWIVFQNRRRYPEISDRFLSALEDFLVTVPQGVQRYQVSEFNLMET